MTDPRMTGAAPGFITETKTMMLSTIPAPPYEELAARLAEVEAERDVAVASVKRQAAAVGTLHASEETEINRLRREQQEWHAAVTTLDGEREANARLTDEVERLTMDRDAAIAEGERRERARALEAITAVRHINAANFKPNRPNFQAYDLAVRDCYKAVEQGK